MPNVLLTASMSSFVYAGHTWNVQPLSRVELCVLLGGRAERLRLCGQMINRGGPRGGRHWVIFLGGLRHQNISDIEHILQKTLNQRKWIQVCLIQVKTNFPLWKIWRCLNIFLTFSPLPCQVQPRVLSYHINCNNNLLSYASIYVMTYLL